MSMEAALDAVSSGETKKRLEGVEQLRDIAEAGSLSREACSRIADAVYSLLSDSNAKAAQGALQAATAALRASPGAFKQHTERLTGEVVERLGDNKHFVREAARGFLLQAASAGKGWPGWVAERLEEGGALRHKNWRVREEALKLTLDLLKAHGPDPLGGSQALLSRALGFLDDNISSVRMTAMDLIEQLYAILGEPLRQEVAKAGVRSAHLRDLESRFENARRRSPSPPPGKPSQAPGRSSEAGQEGDESAGEEAEAEAVRKEGERGAIRRLKQILEELDAPGEEWSRRRQALHRIERLVAAAGSYHGFAQALRGDAAGLLRAQLVDRRSVVAKEACATLSTCLGHLGAESDPLLEGMGAVEVLAGLAQQTVHVVAEGAEACLRQAAVKSLSPKVIRALTATLRHNKSVKARLAACRALAAAVEEWDDIYLDSASDAFADGLALGASDAGQESRAASRGAIATLQSRRPPLAESIIARLEPQHRRGLGGSRPDTASASHSFGQQQQATSKRRPRSSLPDRSQRRLAQASRTSSAPSRPQAEGPTVEVVEPGTGLAHGREGAEHVEKEEQAGAGIERGGREEEGREDAEASAVRAAIEACRRGSRAGWQGRADALRKATEAITAGDEEATSEILMAAGDVAGDGAADGRAITAAIDIVREGLPVCRAGEAERAAETLIPALCGRLGDQRHQVRQGATEALAKLADKCSAAGLSAGILRALDLGRPAKARAGALEFAARHVCSPGLPSSAVRSLTQRAARQGADQRTVATGLRQASCSFIASLLLAGGQTKSACSNALSALVAEELDALLPDLEGLFPGVRQLVRQPDTAPTHHPNTTNASALRRRSGTATEAVEALSHENDTRARERAARVLAEDPWRAPQGTAEALARVSAVGEGTEAGVARAAETALEAVLGATPPLEGFRALMRVIGKGGPAAVGGARHAKALVRRVASEVGEETLASELESDRGYLDALVGLLSREEVEARKGGVEALAAAWACLPDRLTPVLSSRLSAAQLRLVTLYCHRQQALPTKPNRPPFWPHPSVNANSSSNGPEAASHFSSLGASKVRRPQQQHNAL